MDELIRRKDALDALLFAMCGTGYQKRAMDVIREIPAASDVATVRHGRWIPEEREEVVSPDLTFRYNWYHCSLCGRRLIGYSNPKDVPYCHCGARMDEVANDETIFLSREEALKNTDKIE